jgi:hypothetical protein
MNCLEVRRRLFVEPNRRDEPLRRHLKTCTPSAAFARAQTRMNSDSRARAPIPLAKKNPARCFL